MLTNETFNTALQKKIYSFHHIEIQQEKREFGESTQSNLNLTQFSNCALFKGSLWIPVKYQNDPNCGS